MAIQRTLKGNCGQDVHIQYQQRLTAVRRAGYEIRKPSKPGNPWSFRNGDGSHSATGFNSELDALIYIEKEIESKKALN